jgi:hypothetical protein
VYIERSSIPLADVFSAEEVKVLETNSTAKMPKRKKKNVDIAADATVRIY